MAKVSLKGSGSISAPGIKAGGPYRFLQRWECGLCHHYVFSSQRPEYCQTCNNKSIFTAWTDWKCSSCGGLTRMKTEDGPPKYCPYGCGEVEHVLKPLTANDLKE